MSATASGSNAKPNGDATNRMGNQSQRYTEEQKAAVIRVRKCQHTAFYEILGVEKTVTDGEIKKAYRKLSLLTHPDKNGYEGADEAFKMVSRAFQILSDPDKKTKYDRFGGDPDSRFGGQPSASSPFSGFSQASPRGRGAMFEEEISPEELFNRFFGGGMGGGFGPFGDLGGGQQFVFNLGGGPGFRVHQFGGGRPRRRPRDPNNPQQEQATNMMSMLMNLLPLIVLFILPMITSLLSGGSSSGPDIRDTRDSRFTEKRVSQPRKLYTYYLDPKQVGEYTRKQFHDLDKQVETKYVQNLHFDCQNEVQRRNQIIQDAQGLFFTDYAQIDRAKKMKMPACSKLKEHGLRAD